MTIEKKMDQMIKSMDALTAALMKISGLSTITTLETHAPESMPQVAHEAPAPESMPQVAHEAPAPPKVETPEPAPITLNQLSDLCLKLVRKNRGWKTKISATIKSFGGELLKDIEPGKYSDLKAALEAIDAA